MESATWKYNLDTTPNYSYIFDFESEFIHQNSRKWMTENWTVAFYYVGLYMAIIFGGHRYMQSRPRFELTRTLIVWNSGLAAFSIMGACRTLPEFIHVLRNYGIYHSVCVPSFIEADKVSGFWTWMFVLSKVPELGDTIFIVLRKKPLIFLHWYHHITVLLYSWFSFTEYTSSARWFVVMNYCVHSVMYTYYALVSMGKYPPKFLAMTITFLQLTQMVIGCAINLWAHNYLTSSTACGISQFNIKLSMAMYFSYFVLFARFFYKAYLSTKPDLLMLVHSESGELRAELRKDGRHYIKSGFLVSSKGGCKHTFVVLCELQNGVMNLHQQVGRERNIIYYHLLFDNDLYQMLESIID